MRWARACGRSVRATRTRSGKRRAAAPDPLRLLEESNKGRLPELIPIRYGRMVRTPFTFYRGAALNMAADLAGTPATGLRVQACGDCHLLNFGDYATPERRSSSTSTIWTRPCPPPGSGTSSAWPRASSLPVATTASAKATPAMPRWRACARIGNAWRNSARCRCWTSGMRASTSKNCSRRSRTRKPASGTEKRLAKARAAACWNTIFPSSRPWPVRSPTIKDNPPLIYHPQRRGRRRICSRAPARPLARLPGQRAGRPARAPRPVRAQGHRDQGRRCRQRRHLLRRDAADGQRRRIPCSFRSKRRGPRSWRRMRARASTPIMASGS